MIERDRRCRPLLKRCLKRQRDAIAELTGPLRPALWLVNRC
jgi:hypothetical protein